VRGGVILRTARPQTDFPRNRRCVVYLAMSNRVYISAYQSGYVAGFESVLSIASELFLGRASRVEATFYASIFQAGVSQLLVPESILDKLPDNAFVREKAKPIKSEALAADTGLIYDMFLTYLPEDRMIAEEFKDVQILAILLSDLCTCLRHNASLMFPVPLPEPESLRGFLPPELLLPASRLLSAVGSAPTAGPLPRFEIRKADLRTYQQIIHSRIFSDFSEAHAALSDQQVPAESALRSVRRHAVRVQEKYVDELRLCRLGVSFLDIAQKFIDDKFGRFPGKVAEHINKLAQPLLEKRLRLVIYDSSQIFQEIFVSFLSHIARNGDNDPLISEKIEAFKKKEDSWSPPVTPSVPAGLMRAWRNHPSEFDH
jgi:hypothetical protein